jgi:hypothetical protein
VRRLLGAEPDVIRAEREAARVKAFKEAYEGRGVGSKLGELAHESIPMVGGAVAGSSLSTFPEVYNMHYAPDGSPEKAHAEAALSGPGAILSHSATGATLGAIEGFAGSHMVPISKASPPIARSKELLRMYDPAYAKGLKTFGGNMRAAADEQAKVSRAFRALRDNDLGAGAEQSLPAPPPATKRVTSSRTQSVERSSSPKDPVAEPLKPAAGQEPAPQTRRQQPAPAAGSSPSSSSKPSSGVPGKSNVDNSGNGSGTQAPDKPKAVAGPRGRPFDGMMDVLNEHHDIMAKVAAGGEGGLEGRVSGVLKGMLKRNPTKAEVSEYMERARDWAASKRAKAPASTAPTSTAKDAAELPKRAAGGAVGKAMAMAKGARVGALMGPTGGRTDALPISVPAGAHVIPADVVSGVGEGNTHAGMLWMDKQFGSGPYGSKAPKLHRAAGGEIPILASDGEYVVAPEKVAELGGGNPQAGHDAIDKFIVNKRREIIHTMANLPQPAKD